MREDIREGTREGVREPTDAEVFQAAFEDELAALHVSFEQCTDELEPFVRALSQLVASSAAVDHEAAVQSIVSTSGSRDCSTTHVAIRSWVAASVSSDAHTYPCLKLRAHTQIDGRRC